jgi:hypothetical protein
MDIRFAVLTMNAVGLLSVEYIGVTKASAVN